MLLKRLRKMTAAILILAVLLSGSALAEKTIVLTFTGDVTLGGRDDERRLPDSFDSIAASKGYDYFFKNFKEMFEQDDLTVINLEGPLTDSSLNKSTKTHAFRGKKEFAKILQISGVDAASLSNNHAADYKEQGDKNTKEALDEYGVHWFKDNDYYLFEKDGIRIAFFGLQNTTLYNEKPKAKFLKAIEKARQEDGASFIVICWHTGTEYKGFHEADTENRITRLINDGYGDLFVNNHPHVAQGMSIVNNRNVFYSLGNFVFGGNRNIRSGKQSKDPYGISLYALVVQVRLTFTDAGQYLGQQAVVYPVFSSSKRPNYKVGEDFPPADGRLLFSNDFQPMRLTIEQAADVYECVRRDTAFELPEMTEKDGLAQIVFPYLPAFDGFMIPEDEEEGTVGQPGASSPTPTRDTKDDHMTEGDTNHD